MRPDVRLECALCICVYVHNKLQNFLQKHLSLYIYRRPKAHFSQMLRSLYWVKTQRRQGGVLAYVRPDLPVQRSLVHPPLLGRLKRFGTFAGEVPEGVAVAEQDCNLMH